MNRQEVLDGKEAVVAEHGPWTSHNIALPFGIYTMGEEPVGDNYRVQKFLTMARDVLRRPLDQIRVLDLACLEGLYAIEFAQHGAEAVGVEGRPANLAKANFAKDALGLKSVTFELGDVRNVTLESHGAFDLVLCSGILYHLDQPDVFRFLKEIRRMCTGMCIIDTRIALADECSAVFEGREYWGSSFVEHEQGLSAAGKLSNLWASLDNDESFWFTRQSLANFLADIGFSSVMECLFPVPYRIREDRITLAAVTGRSINAYNAVGNALDAPRWPRTK